MREGWCWGEYKRGEGVGREIEDRRDNAESKTDCGKYAEEGGGIEIEQGDTVCVL